VIGDGDVGPHRAADGVAIQPSPALDPRSAYNHRMPDPDLSVRLAAFDFLAEAVRLTVTAAG